MINRVWQSLVNWFERGDLIPLLVLVSAVHYANILAAYDWWGVAVAIGLLVDLGHYRVIRAAVRYNGVNVWESVARWVIAAVMTAVSLSYHQRFYADWWLSIPLPLLIAALAWLQRVDRAKPSETKSAAAKPSEPQSEAERGISKLAAEYCELSANPKIALADVSEIERKLSEAKANASERKSAKCETCGFVANNQNALNAHKRVHKEAANE